MFLLEARLKKEYGYTVLRFYAFMACYRVNFTFRGCVNPFHSSYGVIPWYMCFTIRKSLAHVFYLKGPLHKCFILWISLVHTFCNEKVPDTHALLTSSLAQMLPTLNVPGTHATHSERPWCTCFAITRSLAQISVRAQAILWRFDRFFFLPAGYLIVA